MIIMMMILMIMVMMISIVFIEKRRIVCLLLGVTQSESCHCLHEQTRTYCYGFGMFALELELQNGELMLSRCSSDSLEKQIDQESLEEQILYLSGPFLAK